MIEALHAAVTGIQTNMKKYDEAAIRAVNDTRDLSGLARDIVDMKFHKRAIQMNFPTIRAADEMLGSLVDILA
ncbi:MAG: hypothetical protein ABIK28_14965 [Planctomycetota bacterium]